MARLAEIIFLLFGQGVIQNELLTVAIASHLRMADFQSRTTEGSSCSIEYLNFKMEQH